MGEVNLMINGRAYSITCDDGQEQRVNNLGLYVDSRVKEIAKAGAATNETHLLVLASLMLADEVYDLREGVAPVANGANQNEDEALVISAIDSLAERIDTIASRIQEA